MPVAGAISPGGGGRVRAQVKPFRGGTRPPFMTRFAPPCRKNGARSRGEPYVDYPYIPDLYIA